MFLTRLLIALHEAEPIRLWLYSVLTSVVLPGLGLAGVLTGQWVAFAVAAAGVVLVVGGTGEALRHFVYSPATLADRGVIDLPARDVGRVVQLRPGWSAVELSDDTTEIPALFRVAPPRPRPAQ